MTLRTLFFVFSRTKKKRNRRMRHIQPDQPMRGRKHNNNLYDWESIISTIVWKLYHKSVEKSIVFRNLVWLFHSPFSQGDYKNWDFFAKRVEIVGRLCYNVAWKTSMTIVILRSKEHAETSSWQARRFNYAKDSTKTSASRFSHLGVHRWYRFDV